MSRSIYKSPASKLAKGVANRRKLFPFIISLLVSVAASSVLILGFLFLASAYLYLEGWEKPEVGSFFNEPRFGPFNVNDLVSTFAGFPVSILAGYIYAKLSQSANYVNSAIIGFLTMFVNIQLLAVPGNLIGLYIGTKFNSE